MHFHEVGALDAVADVVGSCAAMESLGITRAASSPVAVGSGSVRTAHGVLPVPVPAVLALLAEAGAPALGGSSPEEACTPTGAALLTSFATSWGPLPPMRVTATGTGAGGRDDGEVPNVLRVVLGEETAGGDPDRAESLVLEANVDDLDPRLWPGVLSALLHAGASDAWLTPILMKKGRPAHTLSVLVPADRAEAVRRVVFTESSTIGLREHRVSKHALDRATRTVQVGGRDIRVKLAMLDGEVVNAAPEYDDVVAAAAALGAPAKSVLAAAVAAAHRADRPCMNLGVTATTFALIFPVELPDKTFVASLVLATRYRPALVWVGVSLAFLVQCVVAVTAGGLLALLPGAVVAGAAALLFLVGAVILWRGAVRADEEEAAAEEEFAAAAGRGRPRCARRGDQLRRPVPRRVGRPVPAAHGRVGGAL